MHRCQQQFIQQAFSWKIFLLAFRKTLISHFGQCRQSQTGHHLVSTSSTTVKLSLLLSHPQIFLSALKDFLLHQVHQKSCSLSFSKARHQSCHHHYLLSFLLILLQNRNQNLEIDPKCSRLWISYESSLILESWLRRSDCILAFRCQILHQTHRSRYPLSLLSFLD